MNENAEEKIGNTEPISMLTSLLSNPETLSKVSSIISKSISEESKDISEDKKEEPTVIQSQNENEDSEASVPTNSDLKTSADNMPHGLTDILSLFSSKGIGNSLVSKQQINLLLAIKPYLSDHRRNMIDGFINISRFGEIFQKLTQGDKNVLQ